MPKSADRKSVETEINEILEDVILFQHFLHSENFSDNEIHIIHIHLLSENSQSAGKALGLQPGYFSHFMTPIYKKAGINNKTTNKFSKLVQFIHHGISLIINPGEDQELYKVNSNILKDMQLLYASGKDSEADEFFFKHIITIIESKKLNSQVLIPKIIQLIISES